MRDAVGHVYSNREKNNNKFYVVWVDGDIVNTNWERIGTNGRSKSYPLDTYESAKYVADKIVNEKNKKGISKMAH